MVRTHLVRVAFLVSAVVPCSLPLRTLSAQVVTVNATTTAQLSVTANALRQTLPANTDVTAGFSLSVNDGGPPRASACSQLSISHSGSGSVVRWDEAGFGEAQVSGGGSASLGPHGVRVVWAATTPVPAKLTVRRCSGWNGLNSRYAGSATILGVGTVTHGNDSLAFCGFGAWGQERSWDVTIDASGLTIDLVSDGRGTGGSYVGFWRGSAHFRGSFEIELRPDPDRPCVVTRYGSGCGGAELSAYTDFVVPGSHVLELTAPSPVVAALLGFGAQRRSVPFPPNCTILNDLLFVLPPQVAQGKATLRIVPPAIPGLVFQVQGAAALGSGPLAFSNGLELRCP